MNKMKSLLLIGALGALCLAPAAMAQNIFQTATNYFSTVDMTEQFTRFLFWNEINYQDQINVSDGLGAS